MRAFAPLDRQRPAGAVVAEPLEADDLILVEPGVGMEREALLCLGLVLLTRPRTGQAVAAG